MSLSFSFYEQVLDSYTLEDILFENDLSPADALKHLHEEGIVRLPGFEPLDFGDKS